MDLNNNIEKWKKNIIQTINLNFLCIEFQILSLDPIYSKRYLEKKYGNLLRSKIINRFHKNIRSISTTHTIIKDKLYIVVIGSEDILGIDIEYKYRIVNSQVKERITTFTERKYNLSVLELWVIKEASFKSCYPNNKGHVLKDYELIEWNYNKKKGNVYSKYGVNIVVYVFLIEKFYICFAKREND